MEDDRKRILVDDDTGDIYEPRLGDKYSMFGKHWEIRGIFRVTDGECRMQLIEIDSPSSGDGGR
ncbi:MAG: hypothetical protein ACYTFQ_28555 [Planctomycetota bacterium]|jgi:hypothetical protein